MSLKKLGLGLVLADFVALNLYTLHQVGYVAVFEAMFASLATITAFTDLVIALGMVAFWMWQDARDRGVSVLPYLGLMAAFGSVGSLLYLLVRDEEPVGVSAAASR